MIEIINVDGTVEKRGGPIAFEELQKLVGGWVECVGVIENGERFDVCMNEEGLMVGLPSNPHATALFKGRINMGSGAVGVWVVLSGKDRLK